MGEYSDLFPEIPGWERSGKVKTYTTDNLYDFINGAAIVYLSYGFQELNVAEYSGENGIQLQIEIYRHTSPTQAFGIYARERPSQAIFMDIGGQAYLAKPFLNLVKVNYYLKIFDYKDICSEILIDFASRLTHHLEGDNVLPAILNNFPPEGKVTGSEQFLPVSFLGHDFLQSAFTAS